MKIAFDKKRRDLPRENSSSGGRGTTGSSRRGVPKAVRRAAVVVASVALGLLVSAWFDLFEWLFDLTQRYEGWQLDEALTVVFFASVFLALFYWRSLKRSEEKFRRGERRFRRFIERAADAIFVIRPTGEVLAANRRAREGLGYSHEELVGLHISEVGFELSEDGELFAVGGVQRRKDGTTFPVEVRSEVIEMDGERLLMTIARDVSERQAMIEEMKRTEVRSRALLDAIPDLVFRYKRDGTVLDIKANEGGKLYVPAEELVGKSFAGFLPEELSARVFEATARALDEGGLQEIEYSLPFPEGELYFEARIVASGADEAVCFARDITGRREAEARSRAVLRSIPDAVCLITRDGRYLDVWAGEGRKLYQPREFVLSSDVRTVLGEEVARRFLPLVEEAIETNEVQTIEYPLSTPEGEFQIEARIVAAGTDEAIYFARDVTERNEASRKLGDSEARNRAILEAIPDAVFRFDREGAYLDVHVNEDFRLYNSKEALFGKTVEETLPPEVAAGFMRAITETLETGESRCFEYTIPDGDEGDYHREARLVKSEPDEVICFVRDIGERKEFEARITRLAYHDELTDLPNRASFMETLAASLERPGRKAMILLKLRGFERVNDSLGREAGDRLLAIVAAHVAEFFGERGEVARFSGDEFAVLVEGFTSFEEVRELIEEEQRIYPNTPFLLDELEVFLRADIGVALVEEGDDPSEVARKASVALLEAQAAPEEDYKVFDREMGEMVLARIHLERDLRLALEYGQLEVHYQPEVFLSSGRIYSFEALARWDHPEHGPISPSVFIPVAEESGLILRLGEYVLGETCRRLRMWHETLPDSAPCSASVNISAVQLHQRDFASRIARTLEENGLEPGCLQLEITESAAMEDLDTAVRALGELKELGVRVALDDFGTGYSSLSCLRQFPLDALKVDRSFIRGLEGDPQMANVVGSIIELAHALDLCVISEGIERPEQLSILRRLGCDVGQGYHFAHPLPPDEALDLLASWRTLDLLPGSG